mgnify:CR=1 FL=1
MELKKIIYVDIDGTICNNTFGRYTEAQPFLDRIKKINSLFDDGNTIIFFTARGMNTFKSDVAKVYNEYYNLTESQLKEWNVKYHKLILGKPSADIYVDDKGIKDADFF